MSGIFAGALALAALQAVVGSSTRSSRIGGLFGTLAIGVRKFLSPYEPLIEDRYARHAGSALGRGAQAAADAAREAAREAARDPSGAPQRTPARPPAPITAPPRAT